MMSRCELVDAEQALRWGLADAVISDGPAGADLQAFITPCWLARSRYCTVSRRRPLHGVRVRLTTRGALWSSSSS
jgi:enoyl-CoA hydratase/carnithine racemase